MATKKKTKVKAKASNTKKIVVSAKRSEHQVNLGAIVSLLSVLLAFSVVMLFYTYKENILASGSFDLFIGLSAFLLVMMLVLQYLINPKK